MILDALTQWSQYAALSPRFAAAFKFLEGVTPDMPAGRHEILGDEVFAFVQRYRTKPYAEVQYEAHRKYLDIQCMIRGSEMLYWAPCSWLSQVIMPFDAEKDAGLWQVIPHGVPLTLSEGHFAILYPEDGHAPGCVAGDAMDVLKVVVKVKL